MLAIRESVFIKYDTENEVNIERAELDVDTAADLPSADYIPGRRLYQGSIAHDISTGDFYSMDSTGTWYNQDGSGAYTPASASALSMPKLSKLAAIAEGTEELETNTEDASDTEEPTKEEAEVSEDAEFVRDPEDE